MATQLIDDSQTDPMDDKVLVSWQSMQKPFRERSKDFYSTVLVLAVLVAIVLFFIEGIMPVLVVAAIVFVLFISTKTRSSSYIQRWYYSTSCSTFRVKFFFFLN